MTGKRLRLDDDERVYLMDLVTENIKLQGTLVSLPIRKLLKKLGNDTPHKEMARKILTEYFVCQDCKRTVKSRAGLNRHTTATHHRAPLQEEKIALPLLTEMKENV